MKKILMKLLLVTVFSMNLLNLDCIFAYENTEKIINTVATVSSKTINVRKGPSNKEKIVHTGGINQVVLLKEKNMNGWYKVEFPNGIVGWCEEKYLKGFKYYNEESLIYLDQSEVDNAINKVVDIAKKQIGKPYVWAAVGPDEFDCSGLMLYSYKQGSNVELTDYSAEQAVKGTYIPKSKLKKGDLVFFDTMKTGRVNHVGMYIGEGKFVHAANPDVGVIVSKISEHKYASKYIAARRIIHPHQSPIDDWSDHWAKETISEAMNKGWVTKSNSFRPNGYITRGEFITIFNKVHGLNKSSGKVFNDTETHWAKYDIDVAVTNGVCNGKTPNEFKPDDFITREEAAVMLANYNKLSDQDLDKISGFSDYGNIASWAIYSVEGVVEKEYILGYSDNTFGPKKNITRAEAIATFSRIK